MLCQKLLRIQNILYNSNVLTGLTINNLLYSFQRMSSFIPNSSFWINKSTHVYKCIERVKYNTLMTYVYFNNWEENST